MGGTHPAYGDQQKRFEAEHAGASVVADLAWAGAEERRISMSLRLSEQSAGVVHSLLAGIVDRIGVLEGQVFAPGSVVVDVGASVGAFAIAVALHFPLVFVYAIEPAPHNFRYMLWNIRANNVSHRVWPLNVALRGPADAAEVSLRYFPMWPTASSRCPSAAEGGCEFAKYSARAVTLQGLLAALGVRHVHWLKLDCEGCEWHVAGDAGLVPLLRTAVGLVTAELHPAEVEPGDAWAEAFVRVVCPDARIRDKLLWGLTFKAGSMPAGFLTEGLPCSASLGPSAAVPAEAPTVEGRIFLLSSFSHDDLDQWPLIPHFFAHYRDRLGLKPELFLLILHSDSRNVSGLARMCQWLNREYGVVHTTPVTEPYSSLLHMRVKHEILHRYVTARDWVVQVDADELVFFPGARRAREALDRLEAAGENVHYGLMVDRVAANGDIDAPPTNRSSLFVQYPLNCALTLLVQSSDVRKACAYRGYLRTTTGNHNVIGLNESLATRATPLRPAEVAGLLAEIRRHFGDRTYHVLPGSEHRFFPAVRPTVAFATVYHFKWVRGLAAKLRRRAQTEVYTNGQYSSMRAILENGHRLGPASVRKLCNLRDMPAPGEPERALSARELTMLFLNIKNEQLSTLLREMGVPESEEAPHIAELLQRNMHYNIARETHLPVH